jgi:hypothetical protein
MSNDRLDGAEAIALYLGWKRRKVFRARERRWSVQTTMDRYGHLWRDEESDGALANASEKILSTGTL